MMRIYTRTGDKGETEFPGGARISKACPCMEAYGALDEINSALGILKLHLQGDAHARMERIQRDLFQLGLCLAASPQSPAQTGPELWPMAEMEADIDRLSAMAPPIHAFVLPEGTPGSAYAHWARTECRRAERRIVALAAERTVDPAILIYINRLSDWLFALARSENARQGKADALWP